jgi:hypothetical protein
VGRLQQRLIVVSAAEWMTRSQWHFGFGDNALDCRASAHRVTSGAVVAAGHPLA